VEAGLHVCIFLKGDLLGQRVLKWPKNRLKVGRGNTKPFSMLTGTTSPPMTYAYARGSLGRVARIQPDILIEQRHRCFLPTFLKDIGAQ
jgi:hypothetical protein